MKLEYKTNDTCFTYWVNPAGIQGIRYTKGLIPDKIKYEFCFYGEWYFLSEESFSSLCPIFQTEIKE